MKEIIVGILIFVLLIAVFMLLLISWQIVSMTIKEHKDGNLWPFKNNEKNR